MSMIRRHLFILCPLALIAFSCGDSEPDADLGVNASLIAEEMTGDHPSCARPHPDLTAADTDGDGVLSDAERQAFREARMAEILAEFDVDEDGELSAEERAAAKAAKRAERFATLDIDEDGLLSPTEVADTCKLEARFAALDSDEDGFISLEEFSVARWGRRGRRGPPGR